MKKFLIFACILGIAVIFGNALFAGDGVKEDFHAKAYSNAGVIVIATDDDLAATVFVGWQVAEPGNINMGNIDALFLVSKEGKASLYMTEGYPDPVDERAIIKTIDYPPNYSVARMRRSVLEALARQTLAKLKKDSPEKPKDNQKDTVPLFPPGNNPREL